MPIRHTRLKTALICAGFFLVAAAGFLNPSVARADVAVSVDKGQSSSQHKDSQSAGAGNNGSKSNGAYSDSVSGSIFYTLTVRNLSAAPAKGVTVEYHIFNKTTATSSSSPVNITLHDITGTSTFDLDGNGVKMIETSDVPKNSTNASTPSSYDKKTGVTTPGTYSSSNTSVMGWVVYVKKGDRVVHTFTSGYNILDDVAKINKKNGN